MGLSLQYRKRYELLQQSSIFARNVHQNCYNTASGMNCCNKPAYRNDTSGPLQYSKRYELLQLKLQRAERCALQSVTIPQAVWTVATAVHKWKGKLKMAMQVTIPQAVWAVATQSPVWHPEGDVFERYNTASGMSCCNDLEDVVQELILEAVTIPQAVWAVATR